MFLYAHPNMKKSFTLYNMHCNVENDHNYLKSGVQRRLHLRNGINGTHDSL